MSDKYTYLGSTPILREQGWPPGRRRYYPPPQNVNLYASRPLPPLPSTAPRSWSQSDYDSVEHHSNQNIPPRFFVSHYEKNGLESNTTHGVRTDEGSSVMMHPPLAVPNRSESYGYQQNEPSQPRNPDLDPKLMAMWTNGDEQVSPIETAGTSTWKNHAVSPLSESPGRGSIDAETWFDDSVSDDEMPSWASPYHAQTELEPTDAVSLHGPHMQSRRSNFRYSDPGSPHGFNFEVGGFDDSGPDAGGLPHLNTSYSHSGHDDTGHSDVPIGDPGFIFLVPDMDKFSTSRPGIPIPAPLRLKDRPIPDNYIKTPFPRSDLSAPSKVVFEAGESSAKQQRRKSGLGNFGASLRSSTQRIRRPPPGFTEVISQIDYHGKVPPVPRVKNMLSKAKQSFRISFEESRKEKSRDELKHSIRYVR
ncbi:hypothetical protein GGS21DRAFT_526813 [Xylaria nigripes]|nr:hypothetical protein GGS21DRAFT_526813 [Xylaria nigripes]